MDQRKSTLANLYGNDFSMDSGTGGMMQQDRLPKLEKTLQEVVEAIKFLKLEMSSLKNGAGIGKTDSNENHGSLGHKFADSVNSIVGLKEAMTIQNKFLRFIWMLLLLGGFGGTVLFTYLTVSDFLHDPTMTKIKLDNNPILDYPPIVLCNDAWFDAEKAFSLGLSLDGLTYSLGFLNYYQDRSAMPSNLTSAEKEFMDFYNKYGYNSLADYFKAITTDLQPLNNSVEEFSNATIPSYLIWKDIPTSCTKMFIPLVAMCYVFTIPPIDSRFGMLGRFDSVQIKFMDRTKGLTPVLKDWQLYLATDGSAATTWPLIIRQSARSMVKIKARKFMHYQKGDTPCTPLNLTFYSHSVCVQKCRNDIMKKVMGCRHFLNTGDKELFHPNEYCNGHGVTKGGAVNYATKFFAEAAKDGCAYCRPRCEKIIYEAILQGEREDTKLAMTAKLHSETSSSNLSLTQISFRLDSIYQGGILTVLEKPSYSFTELITNIGGTLGLFIGGTVLSIAQLVLFVVEQLCIFKTASDYK